MSKEATKEHFVANRGRGLIIKQGSMNSTSPGANYRLFLRPEPSLENMQPRLAIADFAPNFLGGM